MRIPLHRTYRAFPELDRFDDATCRRFMKRAYGTWLAQCAVAAITLAAMVLTVWIVGSLFMTAYQRWGWLSRAMDGRSGFTLTFVVATMPFVAAALAGMLVRDAIVHWMVRRLIRRRGTCPSCGYSLLGLVVPPDLRLTCPECAHVTISSPALHELTVDADGRSIVKGAAD